MAESVQQIPVPSVRGDAPSMVRLCLRFSSETNSTDASNWRNEPDAAQTDPACDRADETRPRGIRLSYTADSLDQSRVAVAGDAANSLLLYPLRLLLRQGRSVLLQPAFTAGAGI